jgi:hypothetical protein
MEVLLRTIPNDYKLKKEFLDKNAPHIEILCLGSSHAYYGINPVYFSKNSFNGSHVSQTIEYDLEILKKYQNKLSQLKYILMPISSFSLHATLKKGGQSWLVKNYYLYYDIHHINNIQNYSEVLSLNTNVNIKRLYSYYIKKETAITSSELGFGLTNSSKNPQDLIETGIKAAKLHTYQDAVMFEENIDHLKSIIQIAQENKSIVIFFTPPAYKTYYERIDAGQLENTVNAIGNISKEYNNVIYKNYLYYKEFLDSDFYDADHLNEIGAEKLTKTLDNLIIDIQKYGLDFMKH